MSQLAFPGIKDPDLKSQLTGWGQTVEDRLPFAKWQYVTAVFTAANADLVVPHGLNPIDPESVRWIPVGQSAAASIYQDTSASRKPWQRTHLYLRSSATGTVRLLLFLEA